MMHALRRIDLANTTLARACATTIRVRLLNLGAAATVSVRRVGLAMSSACPDQREFIAAFGALHVVARQAAPATQTLSPAIYSASTPSEGPPLPSDLQIAPRAPDQSGHIQHGGTPRPAGLSCYRIRM